MTSAVLIPGAGGWAGTGIWSSATFRIAATTRLPLTSRRTAARGSRPTPTLSWMRSMAAANVALVAQSMGAFTAPLVWQRASTRSVVFVNAMIPQSRETPGECRLRGGQACCGGARWL